MSDKKLKRFVKHMRWNFRRYMTMTEMQSELDQAMNRRMAAMRHSIVHNSFKSPYGVGLLQQRIRVQ